MTKIHGRPLDDNGSIQFEPQKPLTARDYTDNAGCPVCAEHRAEHAKLQDEIRKLFHDRNLLRSNMDRARAILKSQSGTPNPSLLAIREAEWLLR